VAKPVNNEFCVILGHLEILYFNIEKLLDDFPPRYV